ncbi:protein CHUP1, chloroplastic-like [Curcuma longa]|uniref:protein CHUP1, chloroplastic-like n=1 Tax=Curcuma longa TaxID=136217 RepID=UPI003D9E7378
MEKAKNLREAARLNPLLLIALPFAGLIFSALTKITRKRNQKPCGLPFHEEESLMDSSSSSCSTYDFDSSSIYQEEEEDDDLEQVESLQRCLENPTDALMINIQEAATDGRACEIQPSTKDETEPLQLMTLKEEIESLNSLVAATADRANEMESEFQDYYSAKEKEADFHKLQIMSLSYKLECLEANNRRLERTIRSQHLKKLRTELKYQQRKINKMQKIERLHRLEARRQTLVMSAREDEWSRIEEELKEVKDFADRLMQESSSLDCKLEALTGIMQSASEAKAEMIKSESFRTVSNQELLDQLELFRYQWYLEMEELIYLGWVGACLSHELTMNQEEEEQEDLNPVQEIEEQLIMENEVVKSCRVEFHDSECSPAAAENSNETCMDLEVEGSKKSRRYCGLKKPRLLRKLRGWAKGKRKEETELMD